MKKIFLFLVIAGSIAACKSDDKKTSSGGGVHLTNEEKEKALSDTANYTTIEWIDSTTRNLGTLKKDEQIEVTFRFRNSGTKNLVIENVTAQCGCTIPEKPQEAFAPGQEGVIRAKFNGSGQGNIGKQITVTANTKPIKEHYLTFMGDVQ